MKRLIIFWLSIVVTVGIRSNFISLRDKDFVGPDHRLEQVLKQRMTAPVALKADLRSFEDDKHTYTSPPSPDLEVTTSPGDTRRQGQGWLGLWFDEYNAENLKPKILQFQQYIIQLSKGFIEEIDNTPLIKKIAMDERFRVATIFTKLDEWLLAMRALYDNMNMYRYKKDTLVSHHSRRIILHYFNYQRVLRHDIDITYTIEFLLHIHTVYSETLKKKNKTAGEESDSDDDVQKEQKAMDTYEKLKDKDLSPDQERYIIQMMEAGLSPTMPP